MSQDQAVAARPQSAKGQSRHVLLNGPRLLKFQTSTNIHEPFHQAPPTAATGSNVAVVPWLGDEKFHSSIIFKYHFDGVLCYIISPHPRKTVSSGGKKDSFFPRQLKERNIPNKSKKKVTDLPFYPASNSFNFKDLIFFKLTLHNHRTKFSAHTRRHIQLL